MKTDIPTYVRRPENLVAHVLDHYFTDLWRYYVVPIVYTYNSECLQQDGVLSWNSNEFR